MATPNRPYSAAKTGPAAPLFSSFGKPTKDFFSKGFPSTHKVEVTTKAENGVNFVVSTERKKTAKADVIVGTFQPKYKWAAYGLDFTGTIDTDNQFKAELSLEDLLLPGVKGSFKGTAGGKQEAETGLEYKHELATLTTNFLWSAKGINTLSVSSTATRCGFTAGLEAKGSFSSGGQNANLDSLAGAVNYKASAHDVTAFLRSEGMASTHGGSQPRSVRAGLSLYYTANKDTGVAAQLDYDFQKESPLTVSLGGSLKLDSDTETKAKVGTDGRLGLAVAKQVNSSFKATLGADLNTFDLAGQDHKFGFAFEIKA